MVLSAGESWSPKILLTVVDLVAAGFFAVANFLAIFLAVPFATGLVVALVVFVFLGCGASISSSSSEAFLFAAEEFFTVVDAMGFFPLILVATALALTAGVLFFSPALVCLTGLRGAVRGVTRDFFASGSSSDPSALRLLTFDLEVADSVVVAVSGDLGTRVEARAGTAVDPAATAFLGGMLEFACVARRCVAGFSSEFEDMQMRDRKISNELWDCNEFVEVSWKKLKKEEGHERFGEIEISRSKFVVGSRQGCS
jgi:hypothetical protein